jgi:hypothetical protein
VTAPPRYAAKLPTARGLILPPRPFPTARYAGMDKARAEVGLPGHCEFCAAYGHVKAHPEYGCGDVGCTSNH